MSTDQLTLRKTVIGGETAPDDYAVWWNGLVVGRILRQPGVPTDRPNWSWGIILHTTRSQLGHHRGIAPDLAECQRRFKVAWSGVLPTLTDDEVAKLRAAADRPAPRPAFPGRT